MFCSKCGTQVPDNAKFCHNCGKPIPSAVHETVIDAIPLPIEQVPPTPRVVSVPAKALSTPIKSAAPTRYQIAISIILVLFLSLAYGLMFLVALGGEHPHFKNQGTGLLIWTILTFWYCWKRMNRRGWVGGTIGLTVFILAIFLSAAIAGYVRGQLDYVLEHSPIARLKKIYPGEYETIRNDLIATVKTGDVKSEEFERFFLAKMVSLLPKVFKTTSDDALLLFGQAKIQISREVAERSADDCVAFLYGLQPEDAATAARISGLVTKQTTELKNAAIAKVFEEAGTAMLAVNPNDENRFNSLVSQLDRTVKSNYQTSVYSFFDLKKPADVRCKAGILILEEVLNLPPNDRTFMLRRLFAQ